MLIDGERPGICNGLLGDFRCLAQYLAASLLGDLSQFAGDGDFVPRPRLRLGQDLSEGERDPVQDRFVRGPLDSQLGLRRAVDSDNDSSACAGHVNSSLGSPR